jgi:transposase
VGALNAYAVPADRDGESVREFRAFTADLQALVAWLRQCQITAVAMESTGVYWIPLYEMLDEAGFEVHLVNARHVKSVPGRKSDVLDCQWLQQLMTFGLLRGAFRPADEVCALRAVWRHRDMLLSYQARHVQHLQKALTQMNGKRSADPPIKEPIGGATSRFSTGGRDDQRRGTGSTLAKAC